MFCVSSVPWAGLQSVIVVFPGHTHLLLVVKELTYYSRYHSLSEDLLNLKFHESSY